MATANTVLITGAARRIGRQMALYFADQGWNIVAHYNTEGPEVGSLSKELEAFDIDHILVQADLSQLDAADSLMEEAFAFRANIDLLINNASRFSYNSPSAFEPTDLLLDYQINTVSPVLIAQRYVKEMCNRKGCVVNMLDSKINANNPDYFTYTLSKYALFSATKAMAMAFAPHTRFCGIAPGITLPSGKQSEAEFKIAHKNNPIGAGCTVEQILRAIEFIYQSESFNGQVITIDGGESLENRERDVAFIS